MIWRLTTLIVLALLALGWAVFSTSQKSANLPAIVTPKGQTLAVNALSKLPIKPMATHAGYNRELYGDGWAQVDSCTMRDKILGRDLSNVHYRNSDDCTVLSGTLHDPYTGTTIPFKRGAGTSTRVQIDHVVAISNTWQTGAQELSKAVRQQLYNDPLELLAVDGPSNEQKSDSDASGWLPPNKSYDCRYVARQIAVKIKYQLWTTNPEHRTMQRALAACPGQLLPTVNYET